MARMMSNYTFTMDEVLEINKASLRTRFLSIPVAHIDLWLLLYFRIVRSAAELFKGKTNIFNID